MAADREATVFRQVAAEVRAEVGHIARTVDELSRRHRFRNLYLFDLDVSQVMPLVGEVDATFAATREDLERFASTLEALADALDGR